ncbi:MAG: zinc ribbon domain-containing protein [Nitriliruptorales bacterium]|nr:zinc ribbon domain-containing protein [Nitriliruptorales bacterium]
MPLYEYRCSSCGDTREVLRGVDDADDPVGCACGQPDTVRLPSLIARSGGSDLPVAGGCCGAGACGCGH